MWTQISESRWKLDDDADRHLLLKAGDRYVELHGTTVHVYTGPAKVADPALPLGGGDSSPVAHARTAPRPDLAEASDDEAWVALAAAAAEDGDD